VPATPATRLPTSPGRPGGGPGRPGGGPGPVGSGGGVAYHDPVEPEPPYPDVEQRPDIPAIEHAVESAWEREGTFAASLARRSSDPEFVFYDGPPFANGLPHYGHLLTGFIKDAVPRYKTMRGWKVDRRFGWDCHGLPVEMEAEQRLGITGSESIEELGIAEFNAYCRSLVGSTVDAWKEYVTRQARWVSIDDAYRTVDEPYMESVMWALSELWKKGLLYEGSRVLPYCWECETPLSNFETRLDDSYRDRQDPAVTVTFTLENGDRLLVWTTTPWTLPSNLAIAVGADLEYAVFEQDGRRTVVGQASVDRYAAELEGATRVGTVTGRDLAGLSYQPLFPFFADTPGAFRVITADFVTEGDGAGAVHLAPGFGEDDQRACQAEGIEVVCPVDERGRFTAEVPDWEGLQVFEANQPIIRELRARGVLVRQDSYVHSYPHCWRSDTPLIYRAMSSWFVKVTAIKDRMIELNQGIDWIPAHVRDGSFGKWLEGAHDWSITRNRYWGSPLPIWKSDDPAYPRVDVYGSLDELARDFGERPADLHRPVVDELVRPNPDDPTGRSMMRRVPDVLDCWFESGAMPFAQVHYPFENREWFESHFPGDFIVEYIGQTRGWFFTLHVLATALFDRAAFRTCLAHGVLLGDNQQKLSKRLKNYPDPMVVFDTVSSDGMRWALLSSPVVRGGDMAIDRRQMEEAVRQVLLPIWNAWYFLSLYGNVSGIRGAEVTSGEHLLDRYILAKTRVLIEDVTERMDRYDLSGACADVQAFLGSLNNWFIRRSRDRFWAEDRDAFDVLHTVLSLLCRVAAPLLPLLADAVYRPLTGAASVHLADWPDPTGLAGDPELVAAMDRVREVCSAASAVRKANGRRVRLPLSSLTVASSDAERLRPFADLIADEVNVRQVRFAEQSELGEEVFQVDLPVVGPRLGKSTPAVVAAMKSGSYEYDAAADELRVLDFTFGPGEFSRRIVALDPVSTAPFGTHGLVALDLEVTPELESEGVARDIARLVNQVRRDEDLRIAQRIELAIDVRGHEDVRRSVEEHAAFLAEETLATAVAVVDSGSGAGAGAGSDAGAGSGAVRGHVLELADGRPVGIDVRVAGPLDG